MQAAGIAFGAHTHTHTSLPVLPDGPLRDEIVMSRDLIALRLGRPPAIFAYPNGDVDGRTARLVAAAEFRGAVTIREDLCGSMASPFLLPRKYVGNWDKDTFVGWLSEVTGARGRSIAQGRLKSYVMAAVTAPLLNMGRRIRAVLARGKNGLRRKDRA